MFVFCKYLYSVFICYIMINIPCCFTKVFKLYPVNPMYYKFYCNIFLDISITICNDIQDANKERKKKERKYSSTLCLCKCQLLTHALPSQKKDTKQECYDYCSPVLGLRMSEYVWSQVGCEAAGNRYPYTSWVCSPFHLQWTYATPSLEFCTFSCLRDLSNEVPAQKSF
jgi:hypothetical protein